MHKKYAWDCQKLLSLLGVEGVTHEKKQTISGMALDSRQIVSGDLFVALQGQAGHGLLYANQAIAQGALAVACDTKDYGVSRVDEYIQSIKQVPLYWVKDLKQKLGWLADHFFGHPSAEMSVIGVTGTNGKSSCVHFIASLFYSLGVRCGVSGTLGVGVYPGAVEMGMTTPDVISVHRHLADLHEKGVDKAVMEVSSHALDQGRVQGVRFDTSVFTNLTHEHQDYHRDMEHYFQAKKILFTQYPPRMSIINEGDAYGRRLLQELTSDTLSYFLENGETKRGRKDQGFNGRLLQRSLQGCVFEVSYEGETHEVQTPFLASFFVANILASMAVLISQGVDFRKIIPFIAKLQAPKGRLERVFNRPSDPMVLIDYAHTPDALRSSLIELKAICEGDLWCVFGCGGDRDKQKRPLMGRIAEDNADVIVLTSDNPRNEEPLQIIEQIQAGFSCPETHKTMIDRAEAIHFSVRNAKQGDIVLVAGKGHENAQMVAQGQRISLDERALISKALQERG